MSNPAQCVRLGGIETSGYPSAVSLSGDYAYVTDGNLQVIDISNPTNVINVATVDLAGSAQTVALSGNYAYIADGSAGWHVIDVSDPRNPVHVRNYT